MSAASRIEEPSRLPAEIAAYAKSLLDLIKLQGDWLRLVRSSETVEAAGHALEQSENLQSRMLEEVRKLRVTIQVAQMPQFGVVAAAPLKGEQPGTTNALPLFDPRAAAAGAYVYHGMEEKD